MINICFVITALLLLSSTIQVFCLEKKVTVNIYPGREECFYETVKLGQVIDIAYQVIDATRGDINFKLEDPKGRIMFFDSKKSETSHRYHAIANGDHKFCFDNTFSHFNTKTVFFKLVIEGDDNDTWSEDNIDVNHFEGLNANEIYNFKVQDVQDAIYKVRNNLNKFQHLQENVKTHEIRERNVAEDTFCKANTWSMVHIFVMLFVGFMQVVIVKSLFDNTSEVHKMGKDWVHGS